jgi:hypothetical protein
MNTSPATDLRQTALDCVSDMGDIFWDYGTRRDASGQYRDPCEVAADAVEKTLREVVFDVQGANRADALLRAEYETLIAELPKKPTDGQIIRTLVANADWTRNGASVVLQLAQRYGTSVLRNALALAAAMQIEDGEAGL